MISLRTFNLTALIENISKSIDLVVDGIPSDHFFRVAFIAVSLSYALGIKKGDRIDLYLAALLHDIGAIEEEKKILLEYEIRKKHDLQKHAIEGYKILRGIPSFENIALIVRDHHNPESENLL